MIFEKAAFQTIVKTSEGKRTVTLQHDLKICSHTKAIYCFNRYQVH